MNKGQAQAPAQAARDMLNGRPNEGVALDTDITAAAQGDVAVEERLCEGNVVGKVTEGDPEDLVGEVVTGNGEILDEDGDLIGTCLVPYKGDVVDGPGVVSVRGDGGKEGHLADMISLNDTPPRIGEEEEARSGSKGLSREGLPDISTLKGLTCNKNAEIVTEDGVVVGELVDGDRKRICREGFQLDDQGSFWGNRGAIVGKAKPIVLEEEEEGLRPFADKGEITVAPDLWALDKRERQVGILVEGDAIHLVGYTVDDDGDIVDGQGNVIGLKPNERGIVMSAEQEPLARVVKAGWKERARRPNDKDGLIRNDNGEAIGQVSLISNAIQEVSGPFTGFEDLIVKGPGFVEDATGTVVGRIIEGDATSLKGNSLNKAGKVLDKYGNVRDRAKRHKASEYDLFVLEGLNVNKRGNVVDEAGSIIGRIVAGTLKKLVGKAVGKDGQVCSETGKLIGQVELLPAEEREEQQGSFNGLHNLNMCMDEQRVLEPSGHVVGWRIEGNPRGASTLAVNQVGEIQDRLRTVVGHVQRCRSQETLRGMNIPADGKEGSNDELQAADGESWGNPAHDDLRNEQPPEAVVATERDEDEKDIHDVLKWLREPVLSLRERILHHFETASKTKKSEPNDEQLVRDIMSLLEDSEKALQECKGAVRALNQDSDSPAMGEAGSNSQKCRE
ncbi:hypothetical protein BDV11DRAFT_175886 [Aspergillus similis]